MTKRPTILLTGFEPFAGMQRNPSADLVRRLARDPGLRSLGLRTSILPVHRWRAPAQLRRLVRRHRPAALVMTGVAVGSARVRFERLAHDGYRSKRDGPERAIAASGPATLTSTLPATSSVAALGSTGVPVEVSRDAGRFTCNLVLYSALSWAAEGLPDGGQGPGRCAFVHVPPTPESGLPSRLAGVPTLELPLLVSSIGALMEHAAELIQQGH